MSKETTKKCIYPTSYNFEKRENRYDEKCKLNDCELFDDDKGVCIDE